MSEHCCPLKSLRNENSGKSPSNLLASGLLELELKAWCKYSGRESSCLAALAQQELRGQQ